MYRPGSRSVICSNNRGSSVSNDVSTGSPRLVNR
ncbi:MAG: hypothetical protein ACERK1_13660 [Anaerolineales bacterium]